MATSSPAWIDDVDLSVAGGCQVLVFEQGFHLFDASAGHVDHGGCRGAVLFAGTVEGHLVLAVGSVLGGLGALVGREGFVAFLLRDDALLEERLHAVIGLAGDVFGGCGLLPQVAGALDHLGARAGVDFLVLGRGGLLHCLGLHQLGLGERGVDVDQRVAGLTSSPSLT